MTTPNHAKESSPRRLEGVTMVNMCVNRDCNVGPRQPPGARSCVECHYPLPYYLAENSSSYQPSSPASRDLPRYSNLETSFSTISASSDSGAATAPSSVYEQMRPIPPSSEYGLPEARQSSFPKSWPKSQGILKHGPDSACFRKPEAPRLPNTPPAFTSNPNSYGSSSEQTGSSIRSTFKQWSPSDATGNKDSTRSCIPCYRRGKSCIMSEGQEKCEFCSSKSLHCKGPITMAAGFTPQHGISKLVERTGATRALLDVIIDDNPRFDVRIMLMAEKNMSSPLSQTDMLKTETLRMDLQNLRDDTRHGIDQETWERVFNVIQPRPENPQGEARDRNANIVRTFRQLCRRFTAALVLLGSPELFSTFDIIAGKYLPGPFLVLDTMRQLSHLASSTLYKIFDELNKYAVAVAPRHRSAFGPETLVLGHDLGLCHHALSHFGKVAMDRTDFPSDLVDLYDIPTSLIEQLKSLGDTFSPNGFRDGCQAISSGRFGLHIDQVAAEGYASRGTRKFTFIEGFKLLLSSSLSSPIGPASSVSLDNPPAVRNFPISRGLLARGNISEQSSHGSDESQTGADQTNDAESQINTGHSMNRSRPEIIKQDLRSQVVQLQQARDELEKTTKEEIASLDMKIASRQLLLNIWPRRSASCEYSEVGAGEEQMLPFTTPVLTHAHDDRLPALETNLGLEKPAGISYFNENKSLRLPLGTDHEDQPKMDLNMSLPIPRSVEHVEHNHTTSDQHSSPPKKRKRAREQRPTPHQFIRQFHNNANTIMSHATDVEPAALTDEQIDTYVSSFKRQPLHTFPAGLSFLTRKSRIDDTQAAGHTESAPVILPANIKPQMLCIMHSDQIEDGR